VDFLWNDWNAEHIAKHGVEPDEAAGVVETARSPYPESIGDGKYIVLGRGRGGRLLQVVFVVDQDGTTYVIHARPLTDGEKHRMRRRMR
jgi:uncharacterized DUF497 family protein